MEATKPTHIGVEAATTAMAGPATMENNDAATTIQTLDTNVADVGQQEQPEVMANIGISAPSAVENSNAIVSCDNAAANDGAAAAGDSAAPASATATVQPSAAVTATVPLPSATEAALVSLPADMEQTPWGVRRKSSSRSTPTVAAPVVADAPATVSTPLTAARSGSIAEMESARAAKLIADEEMRAKRAMEDAAMLAQGSGERRNSMDRFEAARLERQQKEAAAEEERKEAFRLQVLAKQERTRALLAETQRAKEEQERIKAEAIEAERLIAAKKKAEATLRFEEDRRLRAMTPEQRAEHLAAKEAERLAKVAEEEAKEAERLAQIAAEQARVAAEEAKVAAEEAARVAAHEEAERVAQALVLEMAHQVEQEHEPISAPPVQMATAVVAEEAPVEAVTDRLAAGSRTPSPRSSTPSRDRAASNANGNANSGGSSEPVSMAASTVLGSTATPQLTQQAAPTVSPDSSELHPARPAGAVDAAKPLLNDKPAVAAPAVQNQAKKKQNKSSWFCCGSAVDEQQGVSEASRPVAKA